MAPLHRRTRQHIHLGSHRTRHRPGAQRPARASATVKRRVELLTGIELDERGTIRMFSGEACRERKGATAQPSIASAR